MRSIFFIISLCTFLSTFSQNVSYPFTIETYEVEDDEYRVNMKLFRVDTIKNTRTRLLEHVLKCELSDCNSIALELGSYEYTDSVFTFYSYWCRTGDAPVCPFGVRKQVYTIDENKKLKLFSSQLYIETISLDWAQQENHGVKYLFISPKNESERKIYLAYIEEVEKEYQGIFVYGKSADELIQEVKLKLQKKIEKETKNWPVNSFGAKM